MFLRKGMCVRFENGNVAKVHQKDKEFVVFSITDIKTGKTYPMCMRGDTPVTKIKESEWWEIIEPLHVQDCIKKGIELDYSKDN